MPRSTGMKSKKVEQIRARAPELKKLSPSEFNEFKFRFAAWRVASHNLLMVQEAYQSWVQITAHRYGFTGIVEIDPDNGVIKHRIAS